MVDFIDASDINFTVTKHQLKESLFNTDVYLFQEYRVKLRIRYLNKAVVVQNVAEGKASD